MAELKHFRVAEEFRGVDETEHVAVGDEQSADRTAIVGCGEAVIRRFVPHAGLVLGQRIDGADLASAFIDGSVRKLEDLPVAENLRCGGESEQLS